MIELKKICDDAMAPCPFIKTCFVFKRTGEAGASDAMGESGDGRERRLTWHAGMPRSAGTRGLSSEAALGSGEERARGRRERALLGVEQQRVLLLRMLQHEAAVQIKLEIIDAPDFSMMDQLSAAAAAARPPRMARLPTDPLRGVAVPCGDSLSTWCTARAPST